MSYSCQGVAFSVVCLCYLPANGWSAWKCVKWSPLKTNWQCLSKEKKLKRLHVSFIVVVVVVVGGHWQLILQLWGCSCCKPLLVSAMVVIWYVHLRNFSLQQTSDLKIMGNVPSARMWCAQHKQCIIKASHHSRICWPKVETKLGAGMWGVPGLLCDLSEYVLASSSQSRQRRSLAFGFGGWQTGFLKPSYDHGYNYIHTHIQSQAARYSTVGVWRTNV